MNLIEYEKKNVRIVDVDGETFEGYVGDYVFPEDNEPLCEEALILDITNKKNPIQFNSSEIKSIVLI